MQVVTIINFLLKIIVHFDYFIKMSNFYIILKVCIFYT